MGGTNSGRLPAPATLKALRGSAEADYSGPTAPEGYPKAPEWLNEVGQAEWDRLTPILSEMGIVTLADRNAVAFYCQSYANYVAATEEVNRHGVIVQGHRGVIAKNPAVQVQRDALEQMNRWGGKLGLSPIDRVRLAYTPEERLPDDISFLLS
ncbi:phage terminase small subunit P27 family [Streptomyces sp. NPDC056683]|uniref:phage terminase small subunit P27 family n=1 Tax=Streptomyces sp. NPDC056683 TaxID=3345910 RepID=UPI0036A0BF37